MNESISNLLDQIAKRHEGITAEMSQRSVMRNSERMRTLGREHRRLSAILEAGKRYRKVPQGIAEAREILDEDEDTELTGLAQDDLARLESEQQELEEQIRRLLVPPDPNDRSEEHTSELQSH